MSKTKLKKVVAKALCFSFDRERRKQMQGRGLALKKRKQAKMLFSPMVLVVEALPLKCCHIFGDPANPVASTPTFMCKTY